MRQLPWQQDVALEHTTTATSCAGHNKPHGSLTSSCKNFQLHTHLTSTANAGRHGGWHCVAGHLLGHLDQQQPVVGGRPRQSQRRPGAQLSWAACGVLMSNQTHCPSGAGRRQLIGAWHGRPGSCTPSTLQSLAGTPAYRFLAADLICARQGAVNRRHVCACAGAYPVQRADGGL